MSQNQSHASMSASANCATQDGRALTYHEQFTMDRSYLPGVGHIIGRAPTPEEYHISELACWEGEKLGAWTGDEIEMAMALAALRRILKLTPKHLKEDL